MTLNRDEDRLNKPPAAFSADSLLAAPHPQSTVPLSISAFLQPSATFAHNQEVKSKGATVKRIVVQPLVEPQQRPVKRRVARIANNTKKRKKALEADKLGPVIRFLENNKGQTFVINDLVVKFNIKRRIIYDFLVVLSALMASRKLMHNCFQWGGLDLIPQAIAMARNEVVSSLRDGFSIRQMFRAPEDDNLERAAWNLVKLYICLQRVALDLRAVAMFFTQAEAKYATMLRRLYSIAASLESLNLVVKTGNTAEIALVHEDWIDVAPFDIKKNLDERRAEFDNTKRVRNEDTSEDIEDK